MNDNIYNVNMLTKKVYIELCHINKTNINNIILNNLKHSYENKCINEGYIKNNSIKIINYNNPLLQDKYVIFDVIFECIIANAIQGNIIECVVKSITKIGIKAELNNEYSPFIVFLIRDHHYSVEEFSKIKENDIISVKIIGQRFELNDNKIHVIGQLNIN